MKSNTILLPQIVVDPHVHGRDWKERHKTDVEQVLKEAKNGFISISAFMPNTDPTITKQKTLVDYLKIIGPARKNLRLPEQYIWFGLTDDNLFSECEESLKFSNVIGIKVYPKKKSGETVTTGKIGVSDDRVISLAMLRAEKRGKAVAVHCDDPYIIERDGGNTIEAETSYVEKIIFLAKKFSDTKILICHVSCRKSAELIIKARKEGLNIAIELSPHYLWFDKDGTNWNPTLDEVFYKCFNNLRGGEDREFLQSLLANEDVFVLIGSDSACHTTAEKLEKKLGGIPSNQEMVAVIVTLAKKLKLSDERVLNLLSFNASRFLNIPVPRKVVEYQLEERIDDLTYNNGIVTNPWNGTRLLFPKKI
jgi:dihydroorotase